MHVTVVGGGIVGVACAYYLSQEDIDVTLYEKSRLGAGSTGYGGGIRTQYSTPANVILSIESKRVWDDFEDEFGVDIRHRPTGYLFLAREEDTAEKLRADVEMQNELGVSNEFLSPEEATAYCPELHAEQFVGASYSPDDEFVDPHLALQGYADAARGAGTDVREGVEVTAVYQDEGGTVTGVETTEGRQDTDFVVNAAGAWAGDVAELAGINIPVKPTLRRLLLVEPAESSPETLPLTMDLDGGAVFYPEDSEVMVISGHTETLVEADPDAYQSNVDLPWTTDVLEGVTELAGYFGPDTEVRDSITGLYALTPDQNPIIEESIPGFINAVGFSGHGFMHAPATGQIVSELVVDGIASLADVSEFSSSRFERGATTDEQNFI